MKWNGKEKKGSKNIGTSLKGKEVFPWCSSFAAAKLIHWELELRFFSRVLVSSSFSHTRQWHAVLEVNNRLYRTSLLFCPPSQPKQPFTHSLTHRVPFLLYFLLYHQQVAAWSPREKRERERERGRSFLVALLRGLLLATSFCPLICNAAHNNKNELYCTLVVYSTSPRLV